MAASPSSFARTGRARVSTVCGDVAAERGGRTGIDRHPAGVVTRQHRTDDFGVPQQACLRARFWQAAEFR